MATQEAAVHAPEHHTSTGLDNVKMAMWAFLGSECLFFGSLITTYLLGCACGCLRRPSSE